MSPSERRAAQQKLVSENRAAIEKAQETSKHLSATLKEYDRVRREVWPRLRRAGLVR